MNQQSHEFEIGIDESTKIQCFDFSLKCSRPDLITVWILRKAKGRWVKIGKANIIVESSRKAKWADIRIGSDAPYVSLGVTIPNPEYPFRRFRRKGIGGKVVQLMLDYLKQNGIKEIYGEISDVDIVEKASDFWKKQGFTITPFVKPKGHFVARAYKKL